jgi:hypothetical protein
MAYFMIFYQFLFGVGLSALGQDAGLRRIFRKD